MEFQHTQLDNGLTIVAEVSPPSASMAVGFFTRAGSRDEVPQINGVSHYLEHMVFKGTARRTCFDVNRDFDEMGANYNAFTSEENTVYYAAVLPEFQARAVDLLGDILRPALREEDFQMEKNVILEEIALYEDRPQFRLFEKLMQQYFGRHPLGQPVLGSVESIRALTRQQMLDYFQSRYSPRNITVVATGKLDWPALVDQVRQACGHWTPAEVGRELPEAQAARSAAVITDPKLQRQNVGLLSPAPSAQSPQRYAAELLATILGDATGSRLYYELVETAIAEEASLEFQPLDHAGLFVSYLSCDPQRAAQAMELAHRQYRQFMDEGPTAAELTGAKNKIAAATVLSGELPMGRLRAVGAEWVYRHEYTPLDKQVEELLAVSAEQVLEVAREYDIAATTSLGLGPLETL